MIFGNIILAQIALTLNKIVKGDNLNYLPIFVACVHYCFFSLAALIPVICLKKQMTKFFRILIWFLIIFIPLGYSGYEIFGKIVNVGYLFYFIAFCLLSFRISNVIDISKTQTIVVDLSLLLCCLTNPACYVLVGVGFILDVIIQYKNFQSTKILKINFIKSFFAKFSNKLWVVLGIICCLAVIYSSGESPYPRIELDFSKTIEFLQRSLLFYLTYIFYPNINDFIAISLFIFISWFFIFTFFYANKTERITLLAYIAVPLCYVIITFINRHFLIGILNNYNTSYPDRYYYVINITALIPIIYSISIWLKDENITKARLTGKIVSSILIIFLIIAPFLNLKYIFKFDRA